MTIQDLITLAASEATIILDSTEVTELIPWVENEIEELIDLHNFHWSYSILKNLTSVTPEENSIYRNKYVLPGENGEAIYSDVVSINPEKNLEFVSQEEALEFGYTLDPNLRSLGYTSTSSEVDFQFYGNAIYTNVVIEAVIVKTSRPINVAPKIFTRAMKYLIAAKLHENRDRFRESTRAYKKFRGAIVKATTPRRPRNQQEEVIYDYLYRQGYIRGY